jgi:hypothetical protein
MYQICGVQGNNVQRLVAVARSARETLEHCRDASEFFMSIIVIDPHGASVGLAALSTLAKDEASAHVGG